MNYRTRKLVKPEDLNSRNTLFGGRLLTWIDEECFIYCSCQLKTHDLVTKYMSELNFVSPALQGDIVEIGVETTDIGNSSITLRCIVRNKGNKKIIIAIDKIVFVALDQYGNPKPHYYHETNKQIS